LKEMTPRQHKDFPTKSNPKPPEPKYELEGFFLYEGELKIYRRKDGGSQWWGKVYSKTDKKYVRRSLKVKTKERGIIEGKRFYKETLGKIEGGETVIDTTVGVLIKKYLTYSKNEYENGKISKGRQKTHNLSLRYVGEFLGMNIRISSIPKRKFHQYEKWRTENKNIRDTTLSIEVDVWKQCLNYGMEHDYVSTTVKLFYPKFDTKRKRRDDFTPEEYKKITRFFNTKKWKEGRGWYIEQRRQFLRLWFLVLCNTGCRVGELKKLTWSQIRKHTYMDKGVRKETVEINVKPETSKVRKSRTVLGFGDTWKYISQVKEISNYTKPTDYVFPNPKGKEWTPTWVMFSKIMKGSGVDLENRDLSWYSCRHFYGSMRVSEGVEVYLLSVQMGCSVKMIEQHYGHLKVKHRVSELNKWKQRNESNTFLE
jgi:integrase